MRGWWRFWALGLCVLAMAGRAHADAIDFSSNAGLASLFPAGWDTTASTCMAETKTCMARYVIGANAMIVARVTRYASPDDARAWLDPAKIQAGDSHPISGFGDQAIEFTSWRADDGTSHGSEVITFSKACYFVQVGHGQQDPDTAAPTDPPTPEEVDRIRQIATFIDGKVDGSDCPSATIVNVPNPKTGNWTPWLLVPGIGLVLAGGAGLRRPKDPADPQQDPKQYDVVIRTQDDRTDLNCDGEDVIWVYAQVRCNKAEVNTDAITAAIAFTTEGPDAEWLSLGPSQMRAGFKTVPVRAWPPTADSELSEGKATVVVTAVIEGAPARGPVDLDLEDDALVVF